MYSETVPIQPTHMVLNGAVISSECGVRFDYRTLEILLPKRQGISVYAFNSLMVRLGTSQQGTDHFTLDGPLLGLYHDTADPREGPFVNHYLNHVDIYVVRKSDVEAEITVHGRADLSKSWFDMYWYKGPSSGEWSFETTFHIKRPIR